MSEFKMKDYFPQAFLSEINPSFEVMDADFVCYGDEYNTTADQDSAIQHAVLNHDRLVKENQRLTAIATKHATRADELYDCANEIKSLLVGVLDNEYIPNWQEIESKLSDQVKIIYKSRIEAEQDDA